MPASKRWSGSAKKARETWLVAHMRRSASATKPWKAGAVCATSDRVGRKTASVSSENPARTSSGTALLGIHLEIAEAAVEPVDGEAKELRRHGGAEDEREAGIGCLLDQGANIGKGYEVPRKRRPGGPVERALEAPGRGASPSVRTIVSSLANGTPRGVAGSCWRAVTRSRAPGGSARRWTTARVIPRARSVATTSASGKRASWCTMKG